MRALGASRTSLVPGGVLAGPWVRNSLWTAARAVPSLDLRFAENKSLVDATTGSNLVTFTRASSGMFVGSDGVIRTAATNLLLRSEEFGTTWVPTRSSVSSDSATAPNGAATADKLVEDSTATNTHSINQGSISFTTGLAYTFSCYVKEAGRQNVRIALPSAAFTSALNAQFNLTNGSIIATSAGVTSSVQAAGDGWYRCIVTATATTTATGGPTIFIGETATATTISYTGDGTSGLFIWGAQLEQSSSVGEYIPTTSTINSAPRFDHNPTTGESLGLLVEESRTNLVTWSQDFSQADWGKNGSTIVSSAVASPISGVNYQKIEASTANTTVGVTSVAVAAATQQRAVSFFAKPLGNITRVLVVVQGVDARINVNLVDGTATTNATAAGSTVTVFGERFTVSTPSLTNATGVRFFLKKTGETDTNTPTTIAIGEGLYLTGAQMEAGAFPTSYIPTTTATVTRAADVASISGSNFSSWYRQDEGTIWANGTAPNKSVTGFRTRGFVSINNGTQSESMLMGHAATEGAYRGSLFVGNVNQFPINAQQTLTSVFTVANNYTAKTCIAYRANDLIQSADGRLTSPVSSASLPVTDRLTIGDSLTADGYLNGTIRRLTYWPTRLPGSTLQAVTQ